ncbi:hypothetical protein AB0J68_25895 [Micromonospora sp. NPDC049580]|uniref:hypothetical protein n=1 Tax=Micromonospora sp. NPDC049580 TaxID=3154832 RepID=UPI003440C2DF
MTRIRHLLLPAVLLAATLTGCSSDDQKPTPAAATSNAAPTARTVAGTLMLTDTDGVTWNSTTGCQGDGGYDDITPGAQVTITDAAGATVGLGKLGNGILETAPGATSGKGCKFAFTVPDVPAGKGFYGIEVSHRGVVQYPEKQVFGVLALTLG